MAESGFSKTSASEQGFAGDGPRPRRLWPWVLLLLAVAALVVARTLGIGNASQYTGEPEAVGRRLTELSLEPLTDEAQPVTEANLAGKVTLINYWGWWCGPCAVEFPHLVELEQHLRDRDDFQFLSVASNPDPRDEEGLADATQAFLKQQRAEFATYRDPAGRSQRALARDAQLRATAFPTSVVLDREGVIRGLWIGYQPGLERQIRQAIEDALEGKPLPPMDSERS
jgi:thiol-disulfide isomerase/thioredoxin